MKKKWIASLAVFLALALSYVFLGDGAGGSVTPTVPAPNGDAAYAVLNDNIPEFSESDRVTAAYEYYSELDSLGRCGYAMACVGKELMPTEERGSIGQVKPSGWHTVKYDFVDGKYLYNRCHLLGYQLTGENANKKNLITGTRYMNVQGMLPFENMVADYVKETDNHVLYRVTPVFEEDNLIASGVQMEAWSVEDQGEGICFNVYVYNIEPGVTIDYYTGVSCETEKVNAADAETFVLDYGNKRMHKESCAEVLGSDDFRQYKGGREELLNNGYKTCSQCKP